MEIKKFEILQQYYANNGKKIRVIVHKILSKFRGVYQKDYDDFYSIANEVIAQVIDKYDLEQNFDKYIYCCINNRIKTEITKRNCKKRESDRNSISINTFIGEDNNLTIGDTLKSNFVIEKASHIFFDEKIEKYFDNLLKKQREIIVLLMKGYKPFEIREKLNLTEREYNNYIKDFKSYEQVKYLYRDIECSDIKREDFFMETKVTTTAEKTKDSAYSIESLCKKLNKGRIRDNHVLQRTSGQWNNLCKSELISDILQGKSLTQIIISEDNRDNATMYWLIDGKQRCTTMDEFLKDGFAISKNVQRYEIKYQIDRKDENGNQLFNKDGYVLVDNAVFDIRNKKFSQLPDELQEKFKDYPVPIMMNLNCTKEEIAYDIARFNRCRPMNIAQSGWVGLEEIYAEFVDNILKMKFFNEDFAGTNFKKCSKKSGMMRRMIVESIMTTDFLEDYNKNFGKTCKFVSENANDANFTKIYTLVERLTDVSNKSVSNLFNIRDTFLWIGLFSKFVDSGLDDKRFIDFMIEFNKSLHSKKVKGVSFDDLTEKNKSTKDKKVIVNKLMVLETLMWEYLHIKGKKDNAEDFCNEEENIQEENDNKIAINFDNLKKYTDEFEKSEIIKLCKIENIDIKTLVMKTLKFIEENIKPNVTEDDIGFYLSILDDLTLNVDSNSKLIDKNNIVSLIGIVGYACEIDENLDEWIVDYFNRNNIYNKNQKDNFYYMKEDLNKYINNIRRKKVV